jgi:GH24 family phage-related lysozyme (muramidase)
MAITDDQVYDLIADKESDSMFQEDIPANILEHLNLREGSKDASYLDSLGKLTGGTGHLLSSEEQLLYPEGTLIPEDVRKGWLESDSRKAFDAANTQMGELGFEDTNLRDALVGVNFQMGTGWRNKFKGVWEGMGEGDWEKAAGNVQWVNPETKEATSKWHEQTPVRTGDFMEALRSMKQE